LFADNFCIVAYLIVILFSVVKEEIVDDQALLPSYNGRVVTWVWIFPQNVYRLNII